MKKTIPLEELTRVSTKEHLPAITVVLPFEPKMCPKTETELRLKKAIAKAEAALLKNYAVAEALPVIEKLKRLISGLNYNTHKISIAVFVSPATEKLFYLDISVEEKIIVVDSFEARDLVRSKKNDIRYLALQLGTDHSKMYLLSDAGFIRLIFDQPDHIDAHGKDAEPAGHLNGSSSQKEMLTDRYLRHIDKSLSIILKSHPFPLFLVGASDLVDHFRRVSKNNVQISDCVYGNYGKAGEAQIRELTGSAIANWRAVKQGHLLRQLEAAKEEGKLASGMHEVWQSAGKSNGRLLVVEKSFTYRQVSVTGRGNRYANADTSGGFYIKDAVDEVMEKVLENGGDVEFVDNDALKPYGHIALVNYY